MKRKKTDQQPAEQNEPTIKPLPLKEQLKQNTLDRYDLQEIFQVSRNTITNWCKAGILGFTKVGRKSFFNATEIDKLLKDRKQTMVPGEGKKKK